MPTLLYYKNFLIPLLRHQSKLDGGGRQDVLLIEDDHKGQIEGNNIIVGATEIRDGDALLISLIGNDKGFLLS